MFKVNKSHAIDKAWKHYFRDRHLDRKPELPTSQVSAVNLGSSTGFESVKFHTRQIWNWAKPMRDIWFIFPLLVTILFLLASFEVIKSQSLTTSDGGDEQELSSEEISTIKTGQPLCCLGDHDTHSHFLLTLTSF